MKTFFILGRNPQLSRLEIIEFLRARNSEYKEILFEENILIADIESEKELQIQELGGTMWLGKILFEGEENNLTEYLQKTELIPADKFSYSIMGNGDPEIIKEIFKKRKKKAMIKHGKRQIKLQNGTKQEIPSADYTILFNKQKNTTYLGLATQEYDNSDVKKRDMQKPERRESLAISPRLSKILINLSGAKPGDLLLDPFCGIGGILQEALIKKMDVYGIDKDKNAIIGAKENIEWLKKEYYIKNKHELQNKNSKETSNLQFSAIATETPLGKVMKKKPSEKEAKQIITDFEAHIIPILQRLRLVKKNNAKIAITFPVVKNLHVNIKKITDKTGLKAKINPIHEYREDQFISRDIVVLE
jgi:tRNA G10  N-methylase Trm11